MFPLCYGNSQDLAKKRVINWIPHKSCFIPEYECRVEQLHLNFSFCLYQQTFRHNYSSWVNFFLFLCILVIYSLCSKLTVQMTFTLHPGYTYFNLTNSQVQSNYRKPDAQFCGYVFPNRALEILHLCHIRESLIRT